MDSHQNGTLHEMFEDYFLDYASYVILERAIPHLADGLKPVQRRILFSLAQMDDGRYNKVAGVIGHCMRYHPHGDASIGDALVHLGQKGLLIDTQGNWGHPITGDPAAASRYIEARLTPFAREVIFGLPKDHGLVSYQPSYDSRFKEPLTLPARFPLLLFQGAEGIAVGLACKIHPHNFCEILTASIAALKGKDFELLPDYPTGGSADIREYRDGLRGGRVRVRAQIEKVLPDKLIIRQIPYETTTQSLIQSILQAEEKGHLKLKKIDDSTTDQVEIVLHVKSAEPVDLDKTIDALYAFTKCQTTLTAASCLIDSGVPVFKGVTEIVKICAERTKDLLTKELEIERQQLEEKIFLLTLEQIFITQKIYPVIEKQKSLADILAALEKKMSPYLRQLARKPQRKDYQHLTEIKIRRISQFDHKALDSKLQKAKDRHTIITGHLSNTKAYAVNYFRRMLKKYGDSYPRKTTITTFAKVSKKEASYRKVTIYIERKQGFLGTDLTSSPKLFTCSSLAEILTVSREGAALLSMPKAKIFVGKNIFYAEIFQRDAGLTYHMIYQTKAKTYHIKRFKMHRLSRERPYWIAGLPVKVVYLKATRASEPPPCVEVLFAHKKNSQAPPLPPIMIDFATVALRSKTSKGKLLTKHPIARLNSSTK